MTSSSAETPLGVFLWPHLYRIHLSPSFQPRALLRAWPSGRSVRRFRFPCTLRPSPHSVTSDGFGLLTLRCAVAVRRQPIRCLLPRERPTKTACCLLPCILGPGEGNSPSCLILKLSVKEACVLRPRHPEQAGPNLISEAKQGWAWLGLGWETPEEDQVL